MQKWLPVQGYECYYEVSNTGSVRRKSTHVKNTLGVTKFIKGKVMIPRDNGMGYLRVKLTSANKSRRIMLHRIIAEAFIPNPNGFKCVNHKDGNKLNNSIDNLEWCTQSYNVLHGWKSNGRMLTERQKYNSYYNLLYGQYKQVIGKRIREYNRA